MESLSPPCESNRSFSKIVSFVVKILDYIYSKIGGGMRRGCMQSLGILEVETRVWLTRLFLILNFDGDHVKNNPHPSR